MTIRCLSITHYTAPVALRERLSLAGPGLDDAVARLAAERAVGRLQVSGLVILSTCSRLELYAETPDGSGDPEAVAEELRQFLAEALGLELAVFAPHILSYQETAAAEHLCRVAAGLDSMVLGESEILGQVAEAYQTAVRRHAVSRKLAVLFGSALRAGKRVRAKTALGSHVGSLSSVAVELATRALGGALVSGKCVAVVGAGRMARKAARAFRAHGAGELLILSRGLAAAAELAKEVGGEAGTLDALPAALVRADVVLSSTSAPHPIIAAAMVRDAMRGRAGPLVLLDIAVPRDVDPAVRAIPGVQLFDLDDLQAGLDRSLAERRKEIPKAEAIVAEAVRRFEEQQAEVAVLPIVRELRRKAETLRSRELARMLAQLPEADIALRRRLEHFSQSLVNQLLQQPTRRLRAEAGNGHAAEFARIAGALFGLDDPDAEG